MYSYGPPTHGRAKVGRPARTYVQQLCEDTGCCPEDLPRAMDDREEWRERVRDIRATSTTWWWWWWSILCYSNLWVGLNQEPLDDFTQKHSSTKCLILCAMYPLENNIPPGLNKGFSSRYCVASQLDMKNLKKAQGHIGRNVVIIGMLKT